MTRRIALVAALFAGLLSTPAAHALSLTPVCAKATDWPMFGHDLTRSFAATDNCINRGNAARLRPKWFVNTHGPITAEPIVANGIAYAGTYNGAFYAVRLADGKPAWPHPFQVTKYDNEVVDFGIVPGSAAITKVDGRSFVVFGGGATLFVLDARTGALVSHQCVDRVDTTCQGKAGYTTEVESSPAIIPAAEGHGVRIIIGSDVNEHSPAGPAGVISFGFDGHQLTPEWFFDPEAGQTYPGLAPVQQLGHQVENGCNDVWASPTIDLADNTVVFGTRNCSHPDKVKRAKGVTLPVLAESTMAIDLVTGAFRWQHAARSPQAGFGLDYDFGATPNVLAPHVIGEGGKDGFYYVMDGRTGKELFRTQVCNGSDLGGMIGSTAVGKFPNGHQAVFAACAVPVHTEVPQESIASALRNPSLAFSVHAIDIVTHKVKWSTPSAPSYAAPIYSHYLVFVPDTLSDSMLVLGADTGLPLRVQPMNVPPAGPPSISGDNLLIGSGVTEPLPIVENLKHVGGLWDFSVR